MNIEDLGIIRQSIGRLINITFDVGEVYKKNMLTRLGHLFHLASIRSAWGWGLCIQIIRRRRDQLCDR